MVEDNSKQNNNKLGLEAQLVKVAEELGWRLTGVYLVVVKDSHGVCRVLIRGVKDLNEPSEGSEDGGASDSSNSREDFSFKRGDSFEFPDYIG